MDQTTTQHDTPVTTQSQLPQVAEPRNPGLELDLDWVMSAQANTSAIERRAKTLPGRRSVKKDHQAAWLLKAITLIDLTTLAGDDTKGRVRRLCAKARQPVRQDLLDALEMPPITTGAVCVYHDMVETAVDALQGSNIPVAAVSTGFPAGLSPLKTRLAAGGAHLLCFLIERLPVAGEHVAAGDDDVDFLGAGLHGFGDLGEAGFQRREAGGKAGGDGGDGDV